MAYVDFLEGVHSRTKRDYLARMTAEKASIIEQAKQYDYDYWDGDRAVGYGGYHYDGRWRSVAQAMVDYYQLTPENNILDIGCGKGFLLYEFTQILPGIQVTGIDISKYAIEHAKEEIKDHVSVANATQLPFETNAFDLVISINTLHNLYCDQLAEALKEMERVGRKNKYLAVETYHNEQEKVNLMCWVLTGECFFAPREWDFFFNLAGYQGDHSFISFS